MIEIPSWPIATTRERELLDEILASGQWGGFHEIVSHFERIFAAYQHCAHGVSAANGTVTLETALSILGIGPGDEVIVPAISFVSTATAVSRVGATPVFVDIEEESFNMDPDRAEAAVSARTKAILLVHFGGPMANMDRFVGLASRRDLLLVEDAAHAHGSEWRGRRAGSFGALASFSFQNGKVMTAGEGGILTTNDVELATRARSFANQGRRNGEGHFHHFTLGTNFRITALQAAVLIAQLERLPEQIELRARNEAVLKDELRGASGLRWQRVPPEASVHSRYLILGRVDARFGRTRDQLCACLNAQGVPCTPFYPHALYRNALYERGGCRVEPCPVAEACIRDAFWLSHRVLMGDEELTRAVAGAFRRSWA